MYLKKNMYLYCFCGSQDAEGYAARLTGGGCELAQAEKNYRGGGSFSAGRNLR